MKKFTSIILSVIMILNIFCALGITVSAESTDEGTITEAHTNSIEEPTGEPDENGMIGDNVWYKFYNDGTLVIGGEGETYGFRDVIRHDYGEYYRDEESSTSPFSNRKDIIKVIIHEGVTHINESLFLGCENIKSFSLPKTFSGFDYYTLSKCNNISEVYYNGTIYEFMNIPKLDWIETTYNLYIDGKLVTDVKLPSDINKIPYLAFENCGSIVSVDIPETVSEIGWNAFNGCSKLSDINLPSRIDTIDRFTFSGCSSLKNIVIPEGVKEIKWGAFQDCTSLESIDFSYNVSTIGDSAFSNCISLHQINIPDSVKTISGTSFYGCSNIEVINIGKGLNLSFDADSDFVSCPFTGLNNLKRIIVDEENSMLSSKDGVLFVKDKTILLKYPSKKDNTTYSIPNTVTYIGDYAFENCKNLNSIDIPTAVTKIGRNAFSDCESLNSINIPQNITTLKEATFLNCSRISNISIPNSVTHIEGNVFNGCTNISNIEIPDSVTYLGSTAFKDCVSLKTIFIPGSVSYMSYDLFSGCSNLQSINVDSRNRKYMSENGVLYNREKTELIKYPEAITNEYFKVPDGVISFHINNPYLKYLTIPESTQSISKAVMECKNLEKVCTKNRNCSYYNYSDDYESGNPENVLPQNTVIYGYKYSTAFEYANRNNRTFVEIDNYTCEKNNHCFIWADNDEYCIVCGEKKSNISTPTIQPTEPTTADGWVVVKAPTCEESGVEVNYATQESRIIPALGHKLKTVGKKAATYFAKGYTGDKKCTVCGKVISKGKAIAKLKLGTPKVKITADKKKLMVKYTKVKNATGFQVKYTCKGKTKTKTYSTKKSVTKFIKKLKKGTYKVKVRALIKSKGKTAYSNWTKAKKYKVK